MSTSPANAGAQTPTPQTDAFWKSEWLVDPGITQQWANFARVLERENAHLRAALQAVADESQCHHEHNPISNTDRLPKGYTTIRNLACDALAATSPQDGKKEGA